MFLYEKEKTAGHTEIEKKGPMKMQVEMQVIQYLAREYQGLLASNRRSQEDIVQNLLQNSQRELTWNTS